MSFTHPLYIYIYSISSNGSINIRQCEMKSWVSLKHVAQGFSKIEMLTSIEVISSVTPTPEPVPIVGVVGLEGRRQLESIVGFTGVDPLISPDSVNQLISPDIPIDYEMEREIKKEVDTSAINDLSHDTEELLDFTDCFDFPPVALAKSPVENDPFNPDTNIRNPDTNIRNPDTNILNPDTNTVSNDYSYPLSWLDSHIVSLENLRYICLLKFVHMYLNVYTYIYICIYVYKYIYVYHIYKHFMFIYIYICI
jgi:hypothetical protein